MGRMKLYEILRLPSRIVKVSFRIDLKLFYFDILNAISPSPYGTANCINCF